MKFLKIENVGSFDVEAFTLLGVSSSRSSEDGDTIGKFGSGSKMGVITLLRNRINPVVFLSKTRLDFFSKPINVNTVNGGSYHEQVYCKMKGDVNRTEKLAYTLDFGALDWNDVHMALREFVSNALDAHVAQSIRDLPIVEVVDEGQVRAKAGTTRVFVPLTDSVASFFCTLGMRFKHWGGAIQESVGCGEEAVYEKVGIKECALYRRGVLVGTCSPSLFDYNIEAKLDESRNLDSWTAKAHVSQLLARPSSAEYVGRILKHIHQNPYDKLFEGELDPWYLGRISYLDIFKKTFGENAVLVNDLRLSPILEKKGYKPILIAHSCWYDTLSKSVPTIGTVLDADELKGREVTEACDTVVADVRRIWDKLVGAGCTYGKEIPPVFMFSETSTGGAITMGFYRENAIYLNVDVIGNSSLYTQTIIEELGHYCSGANDFTRDFQNWLTGAIAGLLKGCG